jgi:hypothetical protein
VGRVNPFELVDLFLSVESIIILPYFSDPVKRLKGWVGEFDKKGFRTRSGWVSVINLSCTVPILTYPPIFR